MSSPDGQHLLELVRELRATLGRLEVALSLVSDSIVWTDAQGRIQWCNGSFDLLAGRRHIELLGARLPDVVRLERPDSADPADWPLIDSPLGSRLNFSGRYGIRKNESQMVVEVAATREEILPGEASLVYVVHDVTRQTQAEDELRRAKESAEAASSELEAFSYSASHDLRAPLRSIDGFTRLLQEDCSDKLDLEGLDYLRRVRASAQRMAQIIDDLLQLSRVARGELQRATVDLSELARSAAAELQATAANRQVDFRIEAGLTAGGDERLLRLVIENLLRNAWKFTDKLDSATIEFGATDLAGTRAFFVRDNGAGFDMAYYDKLFVPFQRLHAPGDFPGTGVGLATVQRIVRRHGGRVWAQGAVGHGATFTFTLEADKETERS